MAKRPTGAETRAKGGLTQVATDLPAEIATLLRQAAVLSGQRSLRRFLARAGAKEAAQVLGEHGLRDKEKILEKFLGIP